MFTSVKINFQLLELYFLEGKKIFDIKSLQPKYDEIVTAGIDFEQYYNETADVLDQKESEFQSSDSDELKFRIAITILF